MQYRRAPHVVLEWDDRGSLVARALRTHRHARLSAVHVDVLDSLTVWHTAAEIAHLSGRQPHYGSRPSNSERSG